MTGKDPDTFLMDMDELDEEDNFDDENSDVIRAKWTMDGAKTLSEAAAMLREFASYLERLEQEGWQLEGTVQDDYGFLYRGVS